MASTKAHCGDLVPEIASRIAGDDPITGTLYVVGNTEEGTNFIQRLHALDITTGREKFGGPVIITASVAGTGDGSVGGAIAFNPLLGNQRPGLLLNGVVYIAWASHCDLGLYHGWILGYGATNLQQVAVFNATPNGQQGGIWMSGDGLSADTNGIIYGATGNGTFDANLGGIDFGDSVLKLSSTGGLAVVDYFAPFNQQMLADEDLDLGSGGVLVVPTQSATVSNLLVACGKQGTVYVLNRDNLGHFQSGSDSQIVQSLTNLLKASFDTPAYWNGRVYYAGREQYGRSLRHDQWLALQQSRVSKRRRLRVSRCDTFHLRQRRNQWDRLGHPENRQGHPAGLRRQQSHERIVQ